MIFPRSPKPCGRDEKVCPLCPQFVIRPLCANDRAKWWPLWRAYVDYYRADVSDQVSELTFSRLAGDGNHQGLVCEQMDSGALLGFTNFLFHDSTWRPEGYCYLEDLFVDANARCLGIGRLLIEAVVRAASEAHIERVYWHTENDNVVARRLYDSIGELSEMVQYRIVKRF